MKTDPAKRDSTKYCEFHRDHGHRTDDCIQLRKEIEYLIRRGHLCRFMASEGPDQAPPSSPRQLAPTQHQQPLGEIHVISEGFAGGGGSPVQPGRLIYATSNQGRHWKYKKYLNSIG